MHFADLPEGLIVNFAGPSSAGKSTTNKVAASIYGNPRQLKNFDPSDAAVEDTMVMSCDLCGLLDDTDQATKLSPEDRMRLLFEKVDVLTSGKTRERSRSVALQFPTFRVRNLTLTSSQTSMEQFCREKGIRRNDGNRVRLLEIPVPSGDVGGVWIGVSPRKFGVENTAGLSSKIEAAAAANFGVAGQAYIGFLIEVASELPALIKKYRDIFVKAAGPQNSLEGRIAIKVGVGYAALRLAKKAGIIDIKKSRALEIARFAFDEIKKVAFDAPPDLRAALSRLATVMADEAKVPRLSSTKAAKKDVQAFAVPTANTAYMRSELFARICKGDGSRKRGKLALNHLCGVGALVDGSKSTKPIRVSNEEQVRFLVFDLARLSEALGLH